jgi:hypothetical protein
MLYIVLVYRETEKLKLDYMTHMVALGSINLSIVFIF